MIVNALYFNASWTIVFDEVPNPMEFQLSNGDDVVLTKMMTRTSFHFVAAKFDTELLRGIQFTAVAIPYQVHLSTT
jgi:serine protease inhibitor